MFFRLRKKVGANTYKHIFLAHAYNKMLPLILSTTCTYVCKTRIRYFWNLKWPANHFPPPPHSHTLACTSLPLSDMYVHISHMCYAYVCKECWFVVYVFVICFLFLLFLFLFLF